MPLRPNDLKQYRDIIQKYKRKQLNDSGASLDFRRLFIELTKFLRLRYECRELDGSFSAKSVMAEACHDVCKRLIRQGRRPLVFADTADEAAHYLSVLKGHDVHARSWAEVSSERVSGGAGNTASDVIVAVKSVDGSGANMQGYADSIICRPTPGDHLEQMKGRVDRPGQTSKELILVVLVAEHTIEEAKYANIHLAGNFFREYIAPIATRYRERVDLEATLAVGGTAKLKRGTVENAWRRSLEQAGQSGAFARIGKSSASFDDGDDDEEQGSTKLPAISETSSIVESDDAAADDVVSNSKRPAKAQSNPAYAPRNKVLRNKGDPAAVRQAKERAKKGFASLAVRRWLFDKPPRVRDGLPLDSIKRYSEATPPIVMDAATVHKAVAHLSRDPKLKSLIQRVGADALIRNIGEPSVPTQGSLFDKCLRAITFSMVSVAAGNSFLRKLSIKVAVCLERLSASKRASVLEAALREIREGNTLYQNLSPNELFQFLLKGKSGEIQFCQSLLRPLVDACENHNGKRTGYPHLYV